MARSESSTPAESSRWLAGELGGARYFSANLSGFPKTAFTLTFWFRSTQEGTALFLGSTEDGTSVSSTTCPLEVRISSSVSARFANFAEVATAAPGNLLDGADHHVALTFEQPASSSQATVRIYVDTAQAYAGTVTLINSEQQPVSLSAAPLYLATRPPDRSHDNPIRLSDAFAGRVMDVRIWSRALSPGSITDDAWTIVGGTEPGLYLALPLDAEHLDRAANAALDLTAAHRNATSTIIPDDSRYAYFEPAFAGFPVDSRTVEMWVRCGEDTGPQTLLSYADMSSSDHPNDGGVSWRLSYPSNLAINGKGTGVTLTDGQWHHLAVVVDGPAGTDTVYLDGIQKYRAPRVGAGQIPGQRFLLGGQRATDASDQIFAGQMRDVYIWSVARSADDVWADATVGPPESASTLVKTLLLSDSDADEVNPLANDQSPKHFLSLRADQQAVAPAPPTNAQDQGPLDIDDYTVVLMVRPKTAGALFSRADRESDGLHGFWITCTSDGGVQLQEQDGTSVRITRTLPVAQSGINLFDGSRHSLAIRCSDDESGIYVDGVLAGTSQTRSADAPDSVDINSAGAVRIGGVDPAAASSSSSGIIADFFMAAYWRMALSGEALHRAAFGILDGLSAGLLGYWPLSRTLDDASFAGADLTLTTPARFQPAVHTIWAQLPDSIYRFHQIEGIAHRQRDGEQDVSCAHVIDVPAGAAYLYGALTGRGDKLVPPTGVNVSLTDPSGKAIATESDTEALFVKMQGTGVRAFAIKAPQAGKWKLNIAARAQDDFVFQAHVLPAQDATRSLRVALSPLFGGRNMPSTNASRRRDTSSGVTFWHIGFAALAVLATVAAVVAGLVASPFAFPLFLVAGALSAASVQSFITVLDRSNRVNAINQTVQVIRPASNAPVPLAGSVLTILDTLRFPKPSQPDGPSRLNFDVPAGATGFTFHVLLNTRQVDLPGRMTFTLLGPNAHKIPTVGEPFLYEPLVVKHSGLSQGYGAASAPVVASQAGNCVGRWEAKIDLSGVDPTNVQVRVCIRSVPPGSATPVGYSVPVNLFYVGSKWFGRYKQVLDDAPRFINESIYQQAGIHLDCAPVQHLPEDASKITSDLYSDPTAALVKKYSQANAINVYVVENMAIDAGEDANAVGFAVMPGPQGFVSPYSCVFVKARDAKHTNDPVLLATRIAHEIGHSFGLTHPSSCLDSQPLGSIPDPNNALAACKVVLTERNLKDSAEKVSIRGNLMYTAAPGTHLNAQQIFVLQRAPVLTPLGSG